MSRPIPTYATLDDWIAREAIPFSIDSPETIHAAVDKMIASLDDSVELLGVGEALHGGEEILLLRNRLFQRLVEAHGYSAIAIESSFPRARVVNEYIAGRGPASYEAVRESGFGHAFGVLEANRELVEWMRHYNAAPSRRVKLQFYGFDIPTGTIGIASPRQVLHFVLDYFASIDRNSSQKRRECIDPLLGQDADWENPAAIADPTKSVGVSPSATALRIETEELISQLRARRPELVAKSDEARYSEALHYASVARQLLNFHAAMARESEYSERLDIRDALMADNLMYVVSREHGRGKVLAFAHNSHLKRGRAHWQMGADLHTWWTAGSHLDTILGLRYAVIGSAVGVSEANGISEPETGTLEECLTSVPGPALLIPTHKGHAFSLAAIADLPIRSGSSKNPTYFPLNAQSFTDLDWLAVLDSTAYNRGGPPLQEWETNPE
jgi:erythromycin esterase-like protein